MMEYYYRIYGLRVQSQIPFSEALPDTEGDADVQIVFGSVPEFLREAGRKGYGTWTGGFTSAWFRVRDGTQVYVEGGSRITVELSEEPRLLYVTSLLLSAGMALICQQRGDPFFHGSVLYTGEQAVLLCGESGAGKSTVAMELLQKKWGFLADDTVRVHPDTGGMVAEPSYPQQKLCRNMALKCGKPLEELIYIDEERDKYAWRRQDCYVKQSARLGKIFLLRRDGAQTAQRGAVCIRNITGKETLEILSGQLYLADTYRYSTGIPYELMTQLIRIAGQAGIYEVTRPGDGDTLREVVTKILQFC